MSSIKLPSINILNSYDSSVSTVNGPDILLTGVEVFDLELWSNGFIYEDNATSGITSYGVEYSPENNSVYVTANTARPPTGINCIVMGRGSFATGTNNILIGYGQSDSGYSNVIAIKGGGVALDNNLLCLGGPNQVLTTDTLTETDTTHVIRTYINGRPCHIPLVFVPSP